jgi:hypothetical protein
MRTAQKLIRADLDAAQAKADLVVAPVGQPGLDGGDER